MTGIATHVCTAEHGTRARYVSGCRCAPCRESNNVYYRSRQAAKAAALASVVPSGPPGAGTIMRAGRAVAVRTCPGAGGEVCVVDPPTWLRGQGRGDVCNACVERVTVWNGNVPVGPVRDHLMKLRRAGVGYKSVAAACDVPSSVISRILTGAGLVRASTAKRILAVDAGARADHAIATRAELRRMLRVLRALRALGFRKYELARLLGSNSRALQIGRTGATLVSSAAAVDRLWRKVERGDVCPSPRVESALVRSG